MSKKTARILWFFVLPVVAFFGAIQFDNYMFGVHWNNPLLGWILIIISAVAFFGVIAWYSANKRNR